MAQEECLEKISRTRCYWDMRHAVFNVAVQAKWQATCSNTRSHMIEGVWTFWPWLFDVALLFEWHKERLEKMPRHPFT